MSFKSYIRRSPAIFYFITTFTISWLSALILVSSKLFSGEPLTKMDGILMFPVMLIGPCAASIFLTLYTEGKSGFQNLLLSMGKWKVPVIWYVTALFIPPCLINLVLLFLSNLVSPVFTPNFFPIGFLFGIPAGFFEEIGWTGFAFPKMTLKQNIIKAGVVLGLLWGFWHLPVIDFLGAATPHGEYFLPFFLAFVGVLTAMRLLIAFVYSNTESILVAQLMHVISTGSLVMFGPAKISPSQETLWYSSYAVLLWITVSIIFLFAYIKRQHSK